MLVHVEPLDGRLRLGVGIHLDEPESLGAVGVAIDDDLVLWTVPKGVNSALRSASLTL